MVQEQSADTGLAGDSAQAGLGAAPARMRLGRGVSAAPLPVRVAGTVQPTKALRINERLVKGARWKTKTTSPNSDYNGLTGPIEGPGSTPHGTGALVELTDGRVSIREEQGRLEDILKKHLELDSATLIKCGSDSPIDAAREQWSDGSNTLAIAPGEVVVYSRNYVTNRSLEEAGIKVHTIPSAELSRGRGGPRCMSMPLWREDPN